MRETRLIWRPSNRKAGMKSAVLEDGCGDNMEILPVVRFKIGGHYGSSYFMVRVFKSGRTLGRSITS